MLSCQRGKKVKFIRSNELLSEFYRSRADSADIPHQNTE
jgi:hypothetical protein